MSIGYRQANRSSLVASLLLLAGILITPCKAAEPELKLVVRRGPQLPVGEAGISATGKFVVTAGEEGGFFVADGVTGHEIFRTPNDQTIYDSVAISADGVHVAVGKRTGGIEIWDTQKPDRRDINFGEKWTHVAMSVDESALAAWTYNEAAVFRGELQPFYQSIPANDFTDGFQGAILSADAKRILTATRTRMWMHDVDSGRPLWMADLPQRQGERSQIAHVAFSQDDMVIVTASEHWKGQRISYFDAETGQFLSSEICTDCQNILPTVAGEVAIDKVTGLERKTDQWGRPEFTQWIEYFMVRRIGDSLPDATFKLPYSSSMRDEYSDNIRVSLSQDGNHLVVVSSAIRIWDLTQCTSTKIPTRVVATPYLVGFDSESKRLVAGGGEVSVFFPLNRSAAAEEMTVADRTQAISWTSAGEQAITLRGGKVEINDLHGLVKTCAPDPGRYSDYGIIRTFLQWDEAVNCDFGGYSHVHPALGGQLVGLLRCDRFVDLVTTRDCRAMRPLRLGSVVTSKFALSDSGQWLAYAAQDGSAWIHPTTDTNGSQAVHISNASAVALSDDGADGAFGTETGYVVMIKTIDGSTVNRWHMGSQPIDELLFSSDGRKLAAAARDGTIGIWSTVNRTVPQQTLRGHSGRIVSMALSGDGQLLASGSADGTVRLWKTETGRQVCVIVFFKKGAWAVIDPATGRFDTNDFDGIKEGVYWRVTGSPDQLPLEAYMRNGFQPGLITTLLHETTTPAMHRPSLGDVVPPVVTITNIRQVPGQASADVTVRVRVPVPQNASTPRSGALYLFRDGHLVRTESAPTVEAKKDLDGSGYSTTFAGVAIPTSERYPVVEFAAYVFSKDGVKSETGRKVFSPPEPPPRRSRRAYILTVGIDAYDEPALGLWFAAETARLIQESAGKALANAGFEIVHIVMEATYEEGSAVRRNTNATRKDLETAFALLRGERVDRAAQIRVDPQSSIQRATPDDLLLMYAGTHGCIVGDEFFLLSQEAGAEAHAGAALLSVCEHREDPFPELVNLIRRGGVSSTDLRAWIAPIDAGQMALVIDACHAGAVTGAEFRRGPFGDPNFGQVSYDKGMLVLASVSAEALARATLGDGGTAVGLAFSEAIAKNTNADLGAWLRETVATVARKDRANRDSEMTPALFDFAKKRGK